MAAPHYVAGIDFNPAVRQDAFDVMARLIEHYRNKSTDRAPEQWREPVRNYRDHDQWRQEIQAVFNGPRPETGQDLFVAEEAHPEGAPPVAPRTVKPN